MWATLNDRQTSNRIFIALMAVLISLAWLALWLSDRSGSHGFLHALHSLDAFSGGGAFALVFVCGWTVMIVAMMLPTSLPLIALFRFVARERRDRALLTALLVSGYLATWALFGALVYFGGWLLQEAVARSAWLDANAWILGAGVLGLAGAYQFTPLKYHCLDKCRSPLSFVTEHWRGNRERSQSFRLGAHHGIFCVGCCWSLMLLMFLVGAAGALLWMLVLGAVMAIEKNVSWGRRMSAPLGVLLIGAALALGASPTVQPAAPPDTATVRVPLSPAHGSDVKGSVTFTDAVGGLRVELQARGLPEAGETYPAHLHPGTCQTDPAGDAHGHHHVEQGSSGPVGEVEAPLQPLIAAAHGGASSVTEIENATVARLFSGETDYYVNVHAEAPGSGELPTLACGNLTEDEKTTHDHEEEHHDH
jgi:predicted metal-binding membrane protein